MRKKSEISGKYMSKYCMNMDIFDEMLEFIYVFL